MKKKKQTFNDLLVPILLVICVMPFIIRLAEYTCGYSKYLWYSDNDTIMDLYSYYRCYFFELVAIFTAAVLVFRMALYREKQKPCRAFLPLVLYGGMILVSTIVSINIGASLTGNFYQFQGIIVLLGYLVMAFYTYQILELERDYRIIWYGIIVVFVLMAVIGGVQIFGMDLLNVTWLQRLVMSGEQYELYGGTMDTVFTGNNVFLTLYNPNYAGVFLTMLVSIIFVMFYSEQKKNKKILYGIMLLAGLVLLWFTYSRATFVALFAALLVFLFMERKKLGRILRFLLPGAAVLAVIFLLLDWVNDFHYLSRLIDAERDTSLEEMLTTKEGIRLRYDGNTFLITIEDGEPMVEQENGQESGQENIQENDPESGQKNIQENDQEIEIGRTESGEVVIHTREPIRLFAADGQLNMLVSGQTFVFGKGEEGYFYLTENGKEDQLTEISRVDFNGMEYLGSGRLYIWSRVLPMLKDYLLAGSGPDTFAEVFPQNDYVGKAIYADTPARIMEKPHNDYLLQWVQNGFPALLGLVAFYLIYIKKCVSIYKNNNMEDIRSRLGFGCFLACICYMTGSFFNDSTLYTTPYFWIFIGISLSTEETKG